MNVSFLRRELRPKGPLFTPFNVVSVLIMLTAAVILVVRFAKGLGSVTNLDQRFPWGLWIGFDVVAGVALAGGAYVVTFLVYVMRLELYRPIVRVTVLNGFLAYVFYAGALVLDLGRPWNVINPIIGNSFGLTSVLFLVAWHFMLYMTAELIEFFPAIAEWLGWKRVHRVMSGLTVGAVIIGITLSTLHQSGLGALYLMAKGKIHPLWYSELIPVLFFVSSIFAGLTMVIVEGTLTHRIFEDRLSPRLKHSHDAILIGLARIAAGTMFVYLFVVGQNFIHGRLWSEIASGWGAWYPVEVVGLVAVPMVLLLVGATKGNLRALKVGAILALSGVIINRLNVSVIAFRWDAAVHYAPSWMEVMVTAAVICAEIWVFRWIVVRLPVLGHRPAWAERPGASIQARRSPGGLAA
jgi:Ni/Fe-hydrogenase subunit HybB-like protein